ncbi:MAG: hypothetical protein QM706_02010 [Nitrospira sp.]
MYTFSAGCIRWGAAFNRIARLSFQRDEIQHVGMIDSQYAHIRASPGPSWLDDIRGQVEQAQEGNGTGCEPVCRRDAVA